MPWKIVAGGKGCRSKSTHVYVTNEHSLILIDDDY
jgi:hypothetical protein